MEHFQQIFTKIVTGIEHSDVVKRSKIVLLPWLGFAIESLRNVKAYEPKMVLTGALPHEAVETLVNQRADCSR